MPSPAAVEQTTMTTRDGVRLATEVWLPPDGTPRPAILARTPYSITGARAQHDPIGLVAAGWAVVLQEVRGRFGSEGTMDPFHQEIDDGRDAIAWCAAQPWCTGDVVTMGASYLGATQWLAASSAPKALRAITPFITSPNMHDTWFWQNQLLTYATMTQWALELVLSAPDTTAAKRRKALRLRERLMDMATLPPADNGVADVFPAYGRWLDYRDQSYWRSLDVTRRFSKLDLPAYHVGGWYDVFCEGTLLGYTGLRSSAASEYARNSQRLVIGPWAHVAVFGTGTSAWDFGPAASGLAQGFPVEMHQFLQGAISRTEVPSGATVYVMGSDRWVDLPDWPPASEPTPLYLHAHEGARSLSGDGRLEQQPVEASGVDRYDHDPADPVPTCGGRTLGAATPVAGPIDQRLVEQRDDVLVYTSEPLRSELTVVGEVKATIWFGSTADVADVMVKLVDVHPNGMAWNVVDGASRVRRKSSPARAVEVPVGSTAHCFRPGHRIRVEVASANSPRLDCSPAGQQRVHHGGRTPSHVLLPVVHLP
jgi:putative CocE/NonD family hydrolase